MFLSNFNGHIFSYYFVIFYCTDSQAYCYSRGINATINTEGSPVYTADFTEQNYNNLLKLVSRDLQVTSSPTPSLGTTIRSVLRSGRHHYHRDIYLVGFNVNTLGDYTIIKHFKNSEELNLFYSQLED